MFNQRLIFILFNLFIGIFFIDHSFAKTILKESSKQQIVEFSKPKSFEFITNSPQTFKNVWNLSFSKKAIPAWITIFASTAILYRYDRQLLNGVQKIGRNLGLGNDDKTKTLLKIGKVNIFRGPTDLASLMYFFGDGWTHMSLAATFAIYGSLKSNNRAMQTGSQIFHGMITSTIVNQMSKRSFGRESPYRASNERGSWRPFPNINQYNTNTSKYDAMPSGHIMTATMTYTIIYNNYPEYRNWIQPVGLSMITLLGLQMMNNSVHWASDYPLGVGMGYVFGKIASNYGRKSSQKSASSKQNYQEHQNHQLNLLPIYARKFDNKTYGLLLTHSF